MMLKTRFKHFIGQYPSVFFPFYRTFGTKNNRKLLYSDDVELVIEGFPRSANTFAVVTFLQAQSRPVNIAHHMHVEAQLIQAAAESKPAVALIRKPEDALRSLLLRHPETPVKWSINLYIQFYTAVKKLGDKCLVITYEDITQDMGAVINRVNEHFGSYFDVPLHNESMVESVFNEVDSLNEKIDQGKETHVARPSVERKKQVKNISFNGCEEELRLASELYESMKISS